MLLHAEHIVIEHVLGRGKRASHPPTGAALVKMGQFTLPAKHKLLICRPSFYGVAEPAAIQGWIAPEASTAVPIDAWGDGARAAFKLLTPLIALAHLATPTAPGLLLWEEPELFQNPQTLGKLLREVADIVRGKPIQIFMVSHSLEVIAHLTQMLQEEALSPDETIAFLLNLHQGQLQSTWFESANLLAWLETGLDPRVWGEFVPPVQFRLSAEAEE